jgi:hypothetical protein
MRNAELADPTHPVGLGDEAQAQAASTLLPEAHVLDWGLRIFQRSLPNDRRMPQQPPWLATL